MKITFVSDLHLEFGFQKLPGGEVLILAGDICEARSLAKDFRQTKLIDHVPGSFKCQDFFEYECAKYQKVFMVMGNHEHYHGRFNKTYSELVSMLPENVELLEDEIVEYNGVMFLGSTLWTDLNKGDSITAWHLKSCMNDYRVVQNYYEAKNLYYKLTPEHTAEVHFKTKQYFRMMLSEHREKPFVVVTHHGPTHMSINEKFKHDHTMNGGYVSDLSDLILDNENIKLWIHGHVHDPVDYMIGETRVVCNPRGYPGEREHNGFDPAKFIEV
jgi:Icc-related predicted phosphoesterase